MLAIRLVVAWIAAAGFGVVAQAQDGQPRQDETLALIAELSGGAPAYDPAIPTPQSFSGYDAGETVWPYELLVAYARAVAASSDRLSIQDIGRSHQGRPIVEVVATSPANHARVDQILQTRRAIADVTSRLDLNDEPVVTQIIFGVHGSEPSSYMVAAPMLYHLAAAQDAETMRVLDQSVVVMAITLNPDGAARMAAWVNQNRAQRTVSDPRHRMFDQPWPSARMNHYWFDLNRQWLPAAHPESRAGIEQAQRWLPNVVADIHEMGHNATYFISPGPEEGVNPLLPEELFDLTLQVGEMVRRQMDAEGRAYVTAEFFDDYYIGYGSSYQSYMGAIPFLFEQSSTRGSTMDNVQGEETFAEATAEQFTALYALVRSTVENADTLRAYQRQFFDRAVRDAPARAYVFASEDQARVIRFLELLDLHGIDVYSLARDVVVGEQSFTAGEAYYVPVGQPRGALVDGIFETRIPPGDFVQFYDVSGWTLPHAFGLSSALLEGRAADARLRGASSVIPELAAPAPDIAPYAYVFDWGQHFAPRALNRFLEAGLRAQMLPEPALVETTRGEADVARGAVSVLVRGQELSAEAIHGLMRQAADEDGLRIHAVTSATTRTGPDLGSFMVEDLEAPSVLLAVDDGVNPYDAGAIWFLLDHEMHIPVRMESVSELDASALEGVTHLIFPAGSYGPLAEGFADDLRTWIAAGGVFVATRSGAEWAVREQLASVTMLGVSDADAAAEVSLEDETAAAPERVIYADKPDHDAEAVIGGVIFAAELDNTHPLGFGYADRDVFVHRSGRNAFEPTDDPFATVLRYAEDPADLLASGFVSEPNLERLAGLGSLAAQRSGAGSVILFADEPFFRGYWHGTARLFLNTLFFGTAFEGSYRPSDYPGR